MPATLKTPQSDNQNRDALMPEFLPGRQIEVFYDRLCPLCDKEIKMLRWMDRRQRIQFTDITAASFDPADYGDLTMDDFMDAIQGRLPDGSMITGVEVFRHLYGAVGFKWLVPLTRIPGISHIMDFGYRVFAKNRLKWTGRCTDNCTIPTMKAGEANA